MGPFAQLLRCSKVPLLLPQLLQNGGKATVKQTEEERRDGAKQDRDELLPTRPGSCECSACASGISPFPMGLIPVHKCTKAAVEHGRQHCCTLALAVLPALWENLW